MQNVETFLDKHQEVIWKELRAYFQLYYFPILKHIINKISKELHQKNPVKFTGSFNHYFKIYFTRS